MRNANDSLIGEAFKTWQEENSKNIDIFLSTLDEITKKIDNIERIISKNELSSIDELVNEISLVKKMTYVIKNEVIKSRH